MHMSTHLLMFLIVGVPLILISLGFLALCLRWVWSRGQRADHGKLLEAAIALDDRLAKLEIRITALEDILMGAAQPPPDPKVASFDRELNRS